MELKAKLTARSDEPPTWSTNSSEESSTSDEPPQRSARRSTRHPSGPACRTHNGRIGAGSSATG